MNASNIIFYIVLALIFIVLAISNIHLTMSSKSDRPASRITGPCSLSFFQFTCLMSNV